MTIRSPFPLQWPDGYTRTSDFDRRVSRFVTGMSRAVKSLLAELDRLGAANVIITSNLPTRSSGTPYGSAADPGIAVWFVLDDQERVLACDKWLQAAENLQAICLTVEAMRGMDRWGCSDIVVRAFEGFKALPAGDPAPYPATRIVVQDSDWRVILGFDRVRLQRCQSQAGPGAARQAIMAEVRAEYHRMMKLAHPDMGGSDQAAAALTSAFASAKADIEAGRIYTARHS